MLFNSFEFLLFFPIVTILYFLLPFRGKLSWLLVASCFFYMFFKPEYIVILGFTIVVDYYAGILLERAPTQQAKKRYLVMSLIANIGVLAIFKYFNFFNENITGLASLMGFKNPIPFLKMALPIGLSFHTFQAMSYTIEVYRGNHPAEKDFLTYALYVMFYPQLVAGPIERPQNVLYQFHVEHKFEYKNLVSGLRFILWGLIKKSLIADRLALFVDPVYEHPSHFSGIMIIIATILFSFQMYLDFSGYSDIAIGTARVMGYHLMTNFNKPYFASNILEFWQRWHISLSTWLRDYLYIPLGGNRRGKARNLLNVLIVFSVSGIWHGASWNFALWGFLNGLFVVYTILTRKTRKKLADRIGLLKLPKLNKVLNISGTFAFIVMVRVFFRSKTFVAAYDIYRRSLLAFKDIGSIFKDWSDPVTGIFRGINLYGLGVCFLIVILFELIEYHSKNTPMDIYIGKLPRFWRWTTYCSAFVGLYFLGVYSNRQFIYFQF